MNHDCQCPAAGFCSRYLREMSDQDFAVCRGAAFTPDVCQQLREQWRRQAEERAAESEPGLLHKAANFSKAAAQHARDGGRRVDDDEYRRRLAICRDCSYCAPRRMICRHNNCGCRLQIKAHWRSSTCPLDLWKSGPDPPSDNESSAATTNETSAQSNEH